MIAKIGLGHLLQREIDYVMLVITNVLTFM